MPFLLNFVDATISGDTEISIAGSKDIRITSAASTPRIIGISGELDGTVIAIHNATSTPIPLVHNSGSASAPNAKLLSAIGGDWTLPAGRIIRAALIDPNDAGFADALRGWYLDIRGQLIALDSTVHTAGTFSAALQTQHLVDLSGSAVTAALPAASDANAGTEIVVSQVVAGAGTLNLTPASGKVENASTLALTGSSSAPFLSVRLMSCGTAASGFGWKIV